MGSNIRLICPNLKCRAILSVPQAARGKKVRCRTCGARVTVPVQPNGANPPEDQAEASDEQAQAKP